MKKFKGIVTSGTPEVSAAGVEILREGGQRSCP